MHAIDFAIIVIYTGLTLWIGIWASKQSQKGLRSYFLGGNRIPWYFLGLSNGSGMFDVSGTAWMVGILFLYGVKSFMFMWVWPVWNQIFVMVFLAVWIRRSGVMTGSQWILTRFGTKRAGRASHLVVAVFAVLAAVGFIAYFFEGVGKFMEVLLPWDLTLYWGDAVLLTASQSYALVLIGLTTLYTIKGGVFSVVATEVLQYGIMVVAAIFVAIYAFMRVNALELSEVINSEWRNVFFGWELDANYWSGKYQRFNDLIDTQGYKMFGAFIGMSVFKGFFASVAGPTPSYDLQRILSTKNAKEAAYMSGFTNLILLIPRYLLISGIVVIALPALAPEMAQGVVHSSDLELLLPKVLNFHLPVGLKGLLLAGLLAAFMSTFSAFVNAGPAYVVEDIYKNYCRPAASQRHYIRVSYWASIGIVFLGVLMGFFAESINALTLWITSALFGGYIVPNFLKWVWWRFNGWGYFWGMVAGLVAATFQFLLVHYKTHLDGFLYYLSDLSPFHFFWIIFGVSLLGSLLGTLLTPATDLKTLKAFYKNVRPWGCWDFIANLLKKEEPTLQKNTQFFKDMMNCLIGIIWQSAMILMPIYFMIRSYMEFLIATFIFISTSVILKYTWLDAIKKL